MKKLLPLTLALVLLLSLTAPARADLLWEPDNHFYKTHAPACTYIGRAFYANGPEGFVTVYDAPEGTAVEAQYQNGTCLYVYWQYQDWGCISVQEEERTGWVSMSHLWHIYDSISFEEEFAGQIQDYGGQFADYDGQPGQINFFAYPGAPQLQETRKADSFPELLVNLTGTQDNTSYISKIFVDEDGRTWGYVPYLYGRLNAWFCLDDPEGTDFPVRDVAAPDLIPPQPPVLPRGAYLPYILVAAVVAVSGGLLLWFYKKPGRGK